MKKILVSVRFFVGRKAMSGRPIALKDIARTPGEANIDAYTVIPCEGWYKGKSEESVVIEIHQEFPDEERLEPKQCVLEINKLNKLVDSLRTKFDQEMVITEVAVCSLSRRVEWTHWCTADSGKPFPLPAHIATLVWDVPGASKSLDTPGFFRTLTKSARAKLGEDAVPYEGWPVLVVPARTTLELDLESIDNKDKRCEFAYAIVKRSPELLSELDTRSVAAGSYIARFRRASQSPVFIVNNLDSLLTSLEKETPAITVKEAPYRAGLGCSEMAYLDLLETWLTDSRVEFNKRKFLGCRRPMVTVLTLTRVREDQGVDKVIVKRRAGNVGIYPNRYTCVPWGHLEPLLSREPSVVEVFLQELDEELFGGPNVGMDFDAVIQRLGRLKGKLRYLGYTVDLLRPMVHILLAFDPSRGWWDENRHRMCLNWEYEDEAIVLKGIKEVAEGTQGVYVPATVAAARLAEL